MMHTPIRAVFRFISQASFTHQTCPCECERPWVLFPAPLFPSHDEVKSFLRQMHWPLCWEHPRKLAESLTGSVHFAWGSDMLDVFLHIRVSMLAAIRLYQLRLWACYHGSQDGPQHRHVFWGVQGLRPWPFNMSLKVPNCLLFWLASRSICVSTGLKNRGLSLLQCKWTYFCWSQLSCISSHWLRIWFSTASHPPLLAVHLKRN